MSVEEQDQLASLRIGMAATLSGVPIGTIRVWERRYRVLEPQRTPQGGRLYSMRDVARLRLLRELADRGHAIGTIAGLSDAVLHQRLDIASPASLSASIASGREQVSLMLIGYADDSLRSGLFDAGSALALLPAAKSVEALLAKAPKRSPDVVVLRRDRLHADDASQLLQLVEHLRCGLLLIEYQFSTEAALSRLDRDGIVLLHGPLPPKQLMKIARLYKGGSAPRSEARVIKAPVVLPAQAAVPAPLYSESELLALGEQRSSLKCECPRQISDLLRRLGAFEQYSRQCAIATPQDADEHRRLAESSGKARVLMEQALQQLLQQA
jgi:DNA-binding transcriptional MerR regulator